MAIYCLEWRCQPTTKLEKIGWRITTAGGADTVVIVDAVLSRHRNESAVVIVGAWSQDSPTDEFSIQRR